MADKPKLALDIKESRILRILWITFGFLMVILGIIGALLPVIPGTIFFILAAVCFAKSSEKFYKMLIHNKWVGPHLQNYLEEKFIPIRTKIVAISFLWLSVTVSSIYFVSAFWERVPMFLFAIGMTIYLVMHRSKKAEVSSL
jgi:uncharacterized membrane protein YbaN (DUF454 family)